MRRVEWGLIVLCGWWAVVAGVNGAEVNGGGVFAWPSATPESQGLSSSKLDALKNDLADRKTKAFLVIRHDRIVYEWYAPGHGPTQRHYTASMAKALVAGLSCGVALTDSLVKLDDPAAKYIPQWREDPRKSKITLRQLGSHTAGVEDAEADNLPHNQLTGWKGDFWKQLAPPHDPFTLARDAAPVAFEPGAKMQYSNPGIALLTYCVTAALRDAPQKDIRTLLRVRIMRPIGVPDNEWSAGYEKTFTVDGLPLVGSWGGGSYTARATARVGRLMLRKGNWNGPPLISESAVREITNDAGTPGDGGIGWWSNNSGRYPALPKDAFWGAGAGHQVLLVIPSLNLIAVRNGDLLDAAADFDRGLGERLFSPLMETVVEPARRNTIAPPSASPCPPSPVIQAIAWAPKESIRRVAKGSDRFLRSGLQPVGLRCNYQEDPVSIDTARPSLSWLFAPGIRGQRQTAYRLLVSSSQEQLDKLQGDLWDTGTVPSSAQNQIEYAGRPLAANQRCFWKVKAWDQAGRAGPWSPAAGWTMGLLRPADWQAKWIRANDQPAAAQPALPGTKSENDGATRAARLPLFRHGFDVRKPLRRAIVHVSGLGQYDLFLDGRKVGDHFLEPAWSVYEKTVYYSSYDLTALLDRGAHVFGVMLGKGFYNTAGDRRVHGVQANRPLKLILQAHLLFADGSEQVIVTDASWRAAPGPITHSAILGGEDYDARLWPSGWDRPGFDDSAWIAAAECNGPGGVLTAAAAPPMKSQQVFPPARIGEPAPGIFVYDFGQNASAVPRLRVRGRAGQVIKLVPGEQRHGMSPRRNNGTGLVNQAGVGTPNYFQYTLRGGAEEAWTPQFSYTGFQYLQVEGGVPRGRPNPAGKPVIEELVAVHVRNDSAGAGRFACSNPLFNQIDRLVDWAVRANLGPVLTDCPHREKLGWLEVSYLMGPSIAGRYDIARFYRKIARDCADSQKTDGLIPTVAPAYPAFAGGFAYTPEWGAAAVVLPWQIYQWYGDRTVLSERYATMKGFVDYLRNTSTNLVPRPGLGDWYDYDGKTLGPSQFTPPELSAMATFYRCAQIVAQTAGLLDRADDQRFYRELADRIARAFNDRFFDGAAEYRNHGSPQTANSMALALGLVPVGHESATLERIVLDIQQRNNQQTAGDIGHWYLLQALTQYGRSDIIYTLTARTNLGSYGYIVRNGWTAMPEAWDADTGASMDHCMLGHIQEWFLNDVAGLRPDPAAPGFHHVIIAPQIVGDLEWARGSYDSIRGRIVSDWKRNGSRFTLNVTVPPNTTGTVYLPASDLSSVREHGRPLGRAPGVHLDRMESGVAVLEIASGSYRFQSSIAGPHPRSGLPGRKIPD